MKRNYKYWLLLIPFVLSASGCLKDSIAPNYVDIKLENTAQLLRLLEEKGDYINSGIPPAWINAEEVYNNIDHYLIIDLRDTLDYYKGHIEKSINIKHSYLLQYIKKGNSNSYSKIVLVSASGQAAAYYAGLLRLFGITNIFYLKYGMASWNFDFAKIWMNAINVYSGGDVYDKIDYEKGKFTNLPSISFSINESNIEHELENRINQLMKEEFLVTLSRNGSKSVVSTDIAGINSYDYGNTYIICYGPGVLYKTKLTGVVHPIGSVNYLNQFSASDLRSTRYLQTLPTDKTIVVYTYSGHLSAEVVAYLRVLGYDAKSLLFGANSFIYNSMLGIDALRPYAFSNHDIMNYPYVKGSK